MNKWWAASVALLVLLVFPGLGAKTAAAAATDLISWGEEQAAVYNKIHPYTLNWTGNVLDKGGLNLSRLEYTADSAEADLVINQYGDIGALAIKKLAKEGLRDATKRQGQSFTQSLRMEEGVLYLIQLQNGQYAKIRIDQITPNNGFSITQVKFSYVIEVPAAAGGKENEGGTGGTGGAGGTGGTGVNGGNKGAAEGLEIGTPSEDMYNYAEEYIFEGEGAITLPWARLDGEAMWDLYRSDNGASYKKVSDFPLTETEFTDHYVFVGHSYLYKLVSYDRNGQFIGITDAIKVRLVPAEADAGNEIILQIGNKTAYVNGEAYNLGVAPFIFNGRTVLPLRFVSEALGAEVVWNGKDRSITILYGDDTILLVLDQSAATVNGKKVVMDVPAFTRNSITMVPIRFIAEQLQQEVAFDNDTKQVLITSPRPAATDSPEPNSDQPGNGASQPGGSSSMGTGDNAENTGTAGNGGNAGNAGNTGDVPPVTPVSYYYGSWKMWVPAGQYGADGGTLTINKDGTATYYWNGPKTVAWTYDKASGRLVLSEYKSGGEWIVVKAGEGIAVSSYGVHETGSRG